MASTAVRVPSYRHHRPSGQAVVTIGGQDVYLGKHKSAASRAEYSRVIAEWAAHGGTLPKRHANDLTITELAAAFMRHAKQYYRAPDGKQTTEVANFKPAIARLVKLYGRTRVADFGPLALKAIRQGMIDENLSRTTINHATNRIRRIVKWGVENQIVEPSVLHGLQAVAGLRFGRSGARETAAIKPVPDAFVDATLPYVSPQVAAMIELQRITGMRSGEVTIMRAADIDTRAKVWVYTPQTHKTAWKGHERHVYLGPKAQAVVKPFLRADLQAYLFSPAEAEADRNARRFGLFSPTRKTKVFPCELRSRELRRKARKGRRSRTLCKRYTPRTYGQAIEYGIKAAQRAGVEIPHWHAHQLRHNAATNLRREHGIEVARIILGHRSPAITEVYAEVDHTRAVDVMAKIG